MSRICYKTDGIKEFNYVICYSLCICMPWLPFIFYIFQTRFCTFGPNFPDPQMRSESLKNIWFYTNLTFFASYSLAILRIFVAFPLPVPPSFINCIFLLVSYALTFQGFIAHLKSQEVNLVARKVFTHPNMFCIFLFLCFVPNILLLPFYLLSIYHIVSSIVARKETFQSYFFYNFVVFLNSNIGSIGRTALLLEIVLFPVACGMALFRKIGLITVVAYALMLRQQYSLNNSMKAVAMECIHGMHALVMKMPEGMRMRCLKITGGAGTVVNSQVNVKKNQ